MFLTKQHHVAIISSSYDKAMEFYVNKLGVDRIRMRQQRQAKCCAEGLRRLGFAVFAGEHQSGTVSFLPGMDCQEGAQKLAEAGIAVRAGLHCAPLAHESAGTLHTGTIRISFGHDASDSQSRAFLQAAKQLR